MSKLESALVDWIRAKDAVAAINKQIGVALWNSWEALTDEQRQDMKVNHWLKLAYERAYEGPYDGWYYVNHEEDVEGFLAEHCKHALLAHQLIQQRKPLRAALGVAKRRVSVMARSIEKKAKP